MKLPASLRCPTPPAPAGLRRLGLFFAAWAAVSIRLPAAETPASSGTAAGARSVPSAARLAAAGLAKDAAEAAPLLEELAREQQAALAARRATLQRMQGRSEEEKAALWREMLAAEAGRMERIRELSFRVSAVQKLERERVAAETRAARASRPVGKEVAP